MKHTYAVKRQDGGERLRASGAGPGAGQLAAAFHSGSERPQATGSRKWRGMADGAGGARRHAMHGMADQARVQDLLARAGQGRLRDGEVEMTQRPDVGPMSLRHLAQSLEATATAPGRPVADALQSGSASIGNGRVRLPGIGGAGDPAAIAHQLGVLRPQATRIVPVPNGRFEVQAKLNPWVSVATGRALPELDDVLDPNVVDPQQQHKDGDKHPIELGVEWRSVVPQPLPLQPYDSENTYGGFMQALAAVDGSDMKAKDKQAEKVRLLSDFYHQLKSLSAAQLQEIGSLLEKDINTHEASDTLDKAYAETRLVYKTWHLPGHISGSTGLGVSKLDGKELVGADNLKTVLDPEKFRHYKEQMKLPGSKLPSLGAAPSSLLYPDQPNTVFFKGRGTAAALLPENLNAGFAAYNEASKSLLRGKTSEELAGEFSKLHYHAKKMRASVTRPVFFNKEDIQSNTEAFEHRDKLDDRSHVRKTHSDLHADHNPLRQSFDLKLADPFRTNAIFHQTFSLHSRASYGEWNEMVVKYRKQGHMAGLYQEIREWVPGLADYPGIIGNLIDSGKFNAEYAQATAVKDDDQKIEPEKQEAQKKQEKSKKKKK
ncbi:hypothetical protein GCN74_09550 [Janthinobacterium sp. FT14W]|uniref:hypothetical protein n=1 Tax=Janthinobacterium sp. FT14W TaxID=2654253 RepID=UPI0012648A66|nr:hypothetical protein [Janthinobacterium sp. FT14W]KAB8060202.1 hypothetical protein GCN74_09550 [Janthinobacterium sp. FT14W]